METITTHKKTDFGDVWNINATDGTFRFAIYRYDDDTDTVYLSNVFVKKERRGQGYGNAILDTVDNIAKGMGATAICLTVKKDSFAHQWYERHGYEYLSDNNDKDFANHIWMKKVV
jgi:GNAT superfamily N-acetyltransferase